MKSADPDQAEILHRVRQQLILAQVRIMELEDVRDETETRLADSNQLLRSAQILADQKLDEAAHSKKTLANLQAQFEHLRHVQHVTTQALESTRVQLATAEILLGTEKQLTAGLANQLDHSQDTLQQLESRLGEAITVNTTCQQRIEQLDTELRTLKSSRSWRWTAWLRSLERALGPKTS
jgi:chromosome segregation ATPase